MTFERVLVDSSAWIASFRTAGSVDLKVFLKDAIVQARAAIAPAIILELVQGCQNKAERNSLMELFDSLDLLPVTEAVWKRSYELGYSLRRSGVTVPTFDLLIAAIAIENDSLLLHQDRHFALIAKRSKLRELSFP